MNINLQIVSASIRLTQEKGHPLVFENLSGFAQEFDCGDLSIVYTTPFSGAEIFPGQKAYIVDIWYKKKKVYSIYFKKFDDLSDSKMKPKGEWIEHLMTLKDE
jgi:hypothetical protein